MGGGLSSTMRNSIQIPQTIRLKFKRLGAFKPPERPKEHLNCDSTIKMGVLVMSFEAELIASPVASLPPQISLFHRVWPVAGLGFAGIATAAWSGFLGYELFQLVF
jgi:hypothetical protein